tara:strand:- start:878 stop:1339 length:462 start_codon:yes stop_codon:yes gene_type:complete
MIWLCLICNTENNISELLYNDEKKPRYCKFCRNLDVLSYSKNNRSEYLLDKYLNLNKKIDSLVPTNEIYPKFEITHQFISQFVTTTNNPLNIYCGPSKESILHHIRHRIYNNSVKSWSKYRRCISKKKYKKTLKVKFLSILPTRCVLNIIDFI